MNKVTIDRVLLEERARLLAKASEDVTQMLNELSSGNDEKKSQSSDNKNKNKNKSKRGSQSLGNLSCQDSKSSPKASGNRGHFQRGGGRGRGRGGRSSEGSHINQNVFPENQFVPSQAFPPSYDESISNPNIAFHHPTPATRHHLLSNPPPLSNPTLFQPNYPSMHPAQYPFASNLPLYHSPQMSQPFMNFPRQQTGPIKQTVPIQQAAPFKQPSPAKRKGNSAKITVPPNNCKDKLNVPLVVAELVKCVNFFSTVDSLSKSMNHTYDSVFKILEDNSKYFSTLEDKSSKKVMVELCPAIKMCKEHLESTGCLTKSCNKLHICPAYVAGSCSQKDCPYGHFWKSNQNRSVFVAFHLDDAPLQILHKLMQKVFTGTIMPKICSVYNEQNCQRGAQCENLHICQSYVKSLGNCSNQGNCPFNHNIREPKCKLILEKFGICTNESPRDLLKILADKLEEKSEVKKKIKQKKKQLNEEETANQKEEKKKETANQKEEKKKEETVEQKEENKNKVKKNKADKETKGTVFSNQFHGNIDNPLVCSLGIELKCPYVKTRCRYLHSRTSYYWQFGINKKWFNFHSYHSNILEKNFRNVMCDDFILPSLDSEKVADDLKCLLSLLGNKIIKVNFLNMTIDCIGSKQVFSIRHLTTASSAEGNSKHTTTFNWYFKDDADKWQLFGNSDSSSIEIEKAYQQDSSSSVNITNKFQYKVDFAQMTQQNLNTNKVRPIRRRPAPFAEKDKVPKPIKSLLPAHWETMSDDQDFKLVYLSSEIEEYKKVRQIILSTLPMNEIKCILRVQNAHLWRKFVNKQSELKQKYKTDFLNVPQLFHGLNIQDQSDICRDNLDWRVHEHNLTSSFGNGAYFYISAANAVKDSPADFVGHKFLLVMEVVLGKITEGNSGLNRPPHNPTYNCLFDTTTDQVNNPSLFVKYNQQEYYPSFVVQLK